MVKSFAARDGERNGEELCSPPHTRLHACSGASAAAGKYIQFTCSHCSCKRSVPAEHACTHAEHACTHAEHVSLANALDAILHVS
jgi:hypothetical protein